MSKWSNIKNDFIDEKENKIYINAWLTDNKNEEGKVIAKINLFTKEVIYLDADAKNDLFAQEVIKDAIENVVSKNRPIYIYPRESHTCNLDSPCIMKGNIIKRLPAEEIEDGLMSKPMIVVYITEEMYLNGSRKKVGRVCKYYDSPCLYEYSVEEALKKAEIVYANIQMIKSFPRTDEPKSHYGRDYFEVIDFKLMSDQQLVLAKQLAKAFVGPQSLAVSTINKEIQKRFKVYAEHSLDSLIENAKGLKHEPREDEKKDNKELNL